MIDDLDRKILRALTFDVRLPFATLGSVLGVSEQTVKRRYERLVRAGVARVFVMQNTQVIGLPRWLLRMRPMPGETGRLADLLAGHPDISWVTEQSGSTEVAAIYRPPSESARNDLLRDRLPRTSLIADLRMQSILFRYVSDGGLPGTRDALTVDQERALLAVADPAHRVVDLLEQTPHGIQTPLDAVDERIVAVLERDGRTPYAAVARAVGVGPARVTQRVAALVASGRLYFDLDLAMMALGFHRGAQLYLSCAPSALDRIGRELARAEEVPFVGMTSGPTNLTASAVFRDDAHIYEFVTGTLGRLDGITSMDLAPISRPVKSARSFQAGAVLSAIPPLARR
ncbi:Lrp/AsnC family transcriptional regulator [Tsukamurella soli]|uniref:Lrp/AsnC family transcriptional regulator n=1 Tax=Tsukamurella soli TaxID=644556 RepID=A0ABP8KAM0_9ACTN